MKLYYDTWNYYLFPKKRLIKAIQSFYVGSWKAFAKTEYDYDDAATIAEYFDAHGWHYQTGTDED